MCAGRPANSKDRAQRKRRKSTAAEKDNRAAKKERKQAAAKQRKQQDESQQRTLFVANMHLVSALQPGRCSPVLSVLSQAQLRKQCNYPSCTLPRADSVRLCACGQAHHHICAINAGDEQSASRCATCFTQACEPGDLAFTTPLAPD